MEKGDLTMSFDAREYNDFIQWVIKKYPQYPETQCKKDFTNRDGLYAVYQAEFLLNNLD